MSAPEIKVYMTNANPDERALRNFGRRYWRDVFEFMGITTKPQPPPFPDFIALPRDDGSTISPPEPSLRIPFKPLTGPTGWDIHFLSPRRPHETDEEWARRCAVLRNVSTKPPDGGAAANKKGQG